MLATSVVSQISAQDLFHAASIMQSRTFRDFEVYIVIARLYLALALAFRAGSSPASTNWRSPGDDPGIRPHRRALPGRRDALDAGADGHRLHRRRRSSGCSIALLRVAALRTAALAGAVYIQVVQGTPLLAWLFVFFFGLSICRLAVSPWIAAAAAFSIYAGAFLGEIWRGCAAGDPAHAMGGRRLARPRLRPSSCATSSCRRRSASRSRRPSASSSSSSRTRRSPRRSASSS